MSSTTRDHVNIEHCTCFLLSIYFSSVLCSAEFYVYFGIGFVGFETHAHLEDVFFHCRIKGES